MVPFVQYISMLALRRNNICKYSAGNSLYKNPSCFIWPHGWGGGGEGTPGIGGGTGRRGPGRGQRTAGGASQAEPGEVWQNGETRRAEAEGHPDTRAWGSEASGTWGIRSPPRGGRGATEAAGCVQDEAQGEPLKGSWSVESL